MAAVSFFWDTNMAAVKSCENTLYQEPMTHRLLLIPHALWSSIVNLDKNTTLGTPLCKNAGYAPEQVTYFNRSCRGEECFAKQLKIRRSLSRYMHHSLIQRQYSHKFTTSQETEKLGLSSLYKTQQHLNNWRSRCIVVHSLSDKTYHINNKLTVFSRSAGLFSEVEKYVSSSKKDCLS